MKNPKLVEEILTALVKKVKKAGNCEIPQGL